MSLLTDPPHLANIYGPPTTTTDTGGGVLTTWPTIRQANVGFLFNIGGGTTSMRFDQENLLNNVTGASIYLDAERGDLVVFTQGILAGQRMRVTGLRNQPGVGNIPDWALITMELLQ